MTDFYYIIAEKGNLYKILDMLNSKNKKIKRCHCLAHRNVLICNHKNWNQKSNSFFISSTMYLPLVVSGRTHLGEKRKGISMKIKVITDEKIKDCSVCPLKPTYTRECGKQESLNVNSGQTYRKKPDKRCMINYQK